MFTRIRDLREDKDLKQSNIAELLGIPQSQYQRYESGQQSFPVDKLIKLSRFYNVSVDYLIGLSDIKEINDVSVLSSEMKRLISNYKKLSSLNKDIILGNIAQLLKDQQQQAPTQKKKDIG